MTHSDAAWTPYYQAPIGIAGEPCWHRTHRIRVGSTSRHGRMILVDQCRCGRMLRSAEDISWKEYIWMRRYNQRIEELEL